jgi:hypothetical protein
MKQNLKRLIIISFILAMLFAITGLFLLKYYKTNTVPDEAVIEKMPVQVVKSTVKKNESQKKIMDETNLQVKFNSNEEIKKVYGRLEIVYLFDGREYTGVVLSVDSFYTMVTIDGVKKLPMKDVKMRVLLE